MTAAGQAREDRLIVVGAGWLYASGISHYTYRLTTALAEQYEVGALLMRRLVPRRLYPGRNHVGIAIANVAYPNDVPVYDGVDWYWVPSLAGAISYLDRQQPTVLILQWWTGAVLHSYLRLARHAVRCGAKIILEWHEAQDVGEASLPGTRRYVQKLMPSLLSLVDAHIVHSDFDLKAISASYGLGDAPVHVIPHGPYDHLVRSMSGREDDKESPFQLLSFGVIRPFKGVEDLIAAFSGLTREQAERFSLTVVGEKWEGWTAPDEAIGCSPNADRIERVDRYVTDRELADFVARADAVILPYHRSSSSGPLQIAMTAGLPVVVTAVGGLVEAVEDYEGARLVPPRDPAALREALLQLLELRGQRYRDPHSWEQTISRYRAVINLMHGDVPESQKYPVAHVAEIQSRHPATVAVCAYTEERWDTLLSSVKTVQEQLAPGDRVLVVVDYNDALLQRCRDELPQCTVVANRHRRGLSGARNTAIDEATGSIMIFIDDDAVPLDGWLEALRAPYVDDRIYGVGGLARPLWQAGKPRWFPDEFLWVVGCTHRGVPEHPHSVRNPFGANMSFRRDICRELGGFTETMGRVGERPLGCEETEFSIRLTQANPGAVLLYDPAAQVEHHLARRRSSARYFIRRCWAEGLSKAEVARRVGRATALSAEREYASRVLTKAVWRGIADCGRGDFWGLGRSVMILIGLAVTSAGYGTSTLRHHRPQRA